MNSRKLHLNKDNEKFRVAEYFSHKNEFWNSVYTENTGKDHFIHFNIRKRKEKVFDYLDSFASGGSIKVLDVGCGSGIYLEEMVKRGYVSAGVDMSPAMVKDTNSKLSSYTNRLSYAICADVEKLPFPGNHFDAVICVGVLEYLKDDLLVLKELKRVVRSGGAIIFTLPNKYKIKNLLDPYYYLVRIWQYVFVNLGLKKKKNEHLKGYSTNESFTNKRYSLNRLKSIVRKSGLQLKEYASLGFGPLTLWQKEFVPLKTSLKISDFLERHSSKHNGTLLNKFPNRWVIYTQKEII